MEESKNLQKASEYIRQAERIISLAIVLTAINVAITLLRLTNQMP